MSMRSARRVLAALASVALASTPALASAATESGRALEQPEDFWPVFLYTVLASAALLLVATLGRLYQRQRNLHWPFQDPETPHHEDGGHH